MRQLVGNDRIAEANRKLGIWVERGNGGGRSGVAPEVNVRTQSAPRYVTGPDKGAMALIQTTAHEFVGARTETSFVVGNRFTWSSPLGHNTQSHVLRPQDQESFAEWRDGWDAMRWAKVVALGSRWNLNGMTAYCEHQRAQADEVLGAWRYHGDGVHWIDHVDPCPETGYRCGHAWLYEPVHTAARVELAELLDWPEMWEGAMA